MNGLFVLYKPAGIKSRVASRKVKFLLKADKVGHVGTLDPNTTGVIVMLIGKTTKLSAFLSNADKIYVGKMNLHKEVSRAILLKAFKKFTGEINQRVPKMSAVKRQVRMRKIHYLRLKGIEGRNVEFEIKCQHGTYVRTLCHDLGEYLKVGAHMYELRRIKSGLFTEKDALTFEEVEKKVKKGDFSFILPASAGVKGLKKIQIDSAATKTIMQGTPLFSPGVDKRYSFSKGELIALMHKDELIALGKAVEDSNKLEKNGIAIKTDLVLI